MNQGIKIISIILLMLCSCYRSSGNSSDLDAQSDSDMALEEDQWEMEENGEMNKCPEGMTYVGDYDYCIDSYEASKGPDGKEQSVKDAQPWGFVTWNEAREACLEVDKELCDDSIWYNICSRGGRQEYPYGDQYVEGRCNGGVMPHHVSHTGMYEECEGGYPGIFDMSGNVWEYTANQQLIENEIIGRGGDISVARACHEFGLGGQNPDEAGSGDLGFRCCRRPLY